MDVFNPGRSILTLGAGMKTQCRGPALSGDPFQQGNGLIRGSAKFAAKIIGRALHRQGKTHCDFLVTGHGGQLIQLGLLIHRPAGHILRDPRCDFSHRTHRVVVMHHRVRAGQAYGRHLRRRGHVKGRDPGRHQIRQHRLVRVGLDRIGDHPVKTRLKPLRHLVQHPWREIKDRVIRVVSRQVSFRVKP